MSVFSFGFMSSFVFSFFWFRASGIPCIEKMFPEVIFCSLSFSFLTKHIKHEKHEKRFVSSKDITYVLQGRSWCDVLWKNLTLFGLLVAFWIQEFCVVSCCALSFQFQCFSAHPCRLQSMVLWPVRPSVIKGSTQ